MKGTCTKLLFLWMLWWLWLPLHRSTAQTISTLAGSSSGASGNSGDGGPATEALLRTPAGVTITAAGAIYIADQANNKVRLVNPAGIISTFAGNGLPVYAGDGEPATSASIRAPYNVAVDAGGNVYIADQANHRIRKVSTNGTITTVAGTGTPGYNGDQMAATAARINSPYGIAVDGAGNLYFSEHLGNRIRKVDASGMISTVAGDGMAGYAGHQTPALSARFNSPAGIALDHNGHILVADMNNNLIRRVEPGGNIFNVAGNRTAALSGDGGPATSAALKGPTSVAEDVKGNFYIADKGNNRIRKVSISNGNISTIAGGGLGNDNGPALTASLASPNGIAVDEDGNIFVAEYGFNRIRKIEGFVQVNKTLNEGASTVLTSANLMFPATVRADADIVYTLTAIPSQGILFRDADGDGQPGTGESLALAGTFSQADIVAQTIKYQHDGSESGSDQFGFSVSYGSGKTLSGRTFTFTVEAVNDPPLISLNGPAIRNTMEDSDLVVSGIQVADAEAAQGIVTLELSASKGFINIREDVAGGLSAAEIYGNNTQYVALVASLDAINATFAQNGLVYKPGINNNGADVLVLMLSDNGLTGAGGSQVHQQVIDLAIEAFNDQPVISSNGGGDAANLSIDEKTTLVTTVAATDVANENSTLTYSLSGGADQALFEIDPASGALRFVSPPDFRLPADAGADNTYLVKVRVTDDGFPAPQAFDEQEISVTVLDKTPPRVTSILRLTPAAAATKANEVVFRLSFDEAVSHVDAADFSLTKTGSAAGSIAGVSAAAGTQVDVTVAGVTGDGMLRLDVKDSGLDIADAAGLVLAGGFTAGEAYTIDNTAPVITGVENGLFYANDPLVAFNEGTATLNNSPYDATTPLSVEGHYTLTVTDEAGNFSTLSFDIDKSAPTGSLVINEAAAQTSQRSVSLALTAADGQGSQTAGMRFSHDNSSWTAWQPYAPVSSFELPAGDGLKTVYLQLRDAVGNVSASISDEIHLDQTLPTIGMSSPATRDSVNAPFPVAIAFSEDVSGFEAGDLVLTNGTASDFTALDAQHYAVLVTPAAEGWVKVALPENRAQDQAANGNEVAETLIRFFDGTRPALAIAGPAADPVNAPFTATFTFSEPVSGFAAADIQVSNATVSGFQAQNAAVYKATISPLNQGPVTVAVAAEVAADPAGNANQEAIALTRNYDASRPQVSISAPASDPLNAAFTATFTFSEPVSGFTAGDIQLGNASASNFQAQSGSVYTALITPAADGSVTVAIAADAAVDAAGNGNEAASPLSRHYDATQPAVTLSAPAANPVNAAFTATVTFSEAVSGFDAADLQVSNGAVSAFQAQSATVYTATITPAADGMVSIVVSADAAADAAGNGNLAAAALNRTFDGTQPALTISAPAADPVKAAFTATFTFSEAVSGFTAGDIQLGNASASNFQAQSGSVYTALITPAADGPVAVSVGADAAADAAGNGSVAAAGLSRTFDGTQPALAISAPAADPVKAAFTATFTFSEAVTGFESGDVQVNNGAVSDFTAQSGYVYTALITPAGDGQVSVAVGNNKAVDTAGNGNEAAVTLSRNYDATQPAVTLSAPAANPVNTAFTVTVTFSEAVSGFDAADLQVSNGTVSAFTAQGATVYTVTITPAADGQVSVAVGANAAADAAGNGNVAAAALSRTFDGTQPALVISAPAADPVKAAFTATFTFSEPVTGFTAGDIQLGNASASNFQAQSGSVYTALISPAADGSVTVAIAADAAVDAAGNGNEAASPLSRHYDATQPAVTLSAPAANPVNAAFTVTVTFSEAVSGFDAADLQVSNGTVSAFTAQGATVYTVTITPAADGQVSVAVGANAAADAAGNGNVAAAALNRTFDGTQPALTISAPAADPVKAAFTATFTFSEVVSGFTAGDIQLGNASASNFQAQSGSVYTALITPAADGPVAVSVGADAAADAAGNGSVAAAGLSRTFDGTQPALAISAPAADPVKAAFTATFTFSEPVTGFTAGDIQLSNASASNFQAQSGSVYSALITPAADGPVTVTVGANKAADAAGNGNEAAVALSRNYDATQPVLVLSTAAAAQVNAAFPVTFTFSEAVSGFDAADVQVSNAAVSDFTAQSATVYTATISPSADGQVSVAVGASAAADAAGNGNGAAAPLSRAYDATQPAVLLASTAPAVTNGSPIPVSVSFSEAVTGFVAGDIVVSNGMVSGFTAVDAKTYQALISPGADGPVTVQVAAQVAADAAGNANTASNQLQHQFDGSKPQVVIATTAPAWVNAAFPVIFTFNEPVSGFSAAAVTLVNASLSNFSALSATQYTATLNPAAAGLVSVSVGAGKATDAAGNGNQASQVLSRNYDAVQPAVTLASTSAQELNAPFPVQISFSEAVTGFDLADILVSNGQASGLAQSSAQSYSALITPAGEGQVQVQVTAAAAADQAGNASSASLALGRTYDTTRPSVVLASTAAAVTSQNPIPVSITFSEAVTDFVPADVTVTGGTATSLTGSGTNYQVQVTPAGDGLISVQVAANVARDKATNGNLASPVLFRTFDGSKPTVVITALTSELIRIPFVATITFSEPVTGFVLGDLGITNATASNFQALSSSVYTVLITPAPVGTVVVKVPENAAFDQLQNGNQAAVPYVIEDVRCGNNRDKVLICHKGQMICVALNALSGHLGHGDNIGSCKEDSGDNQPTPPKDVTKPEVVITSLVSGPVQGAFTATFTFSEPVTGFALNDIDVSNGTASNFQAQSSTVYTALITPAANGLVTVGVDANAAADAANNGNLKAGSLLLEFFKCGSSLVDIAIVRNDKEAGKCAKDGSSPDLDLQTIYLGYGDQSLELDATDGAAAGTTYAWTGNGVLSSKTSGKPVFAPTATGVYTFNVVTTSRNGCKASGSVTLTVVDVRYGSKKDKIAVCHNGQVVGLSPDVVAAHLAHGDKLGSCSSGKANARMELAIDQADQVELGIYPNPAKVKTNIEFTLAEAGSYRLAIYDGKGTLVKNIAAGQGESQQFISQQLDVSTYPQGVYLIRLSTSTKVVTKRLLIEK